MQNVLTMIFSTNQWVCKLVLLTANTKKDLQV